MTDDEIRDSMRMEAHARKALGYPPVWDEFHNRSHPFAFKCSDGRMARRVCCKWCGWISCSGHCRFAPPIECPACGGDVLHDSETRFCRKCHDRVAA